MSNNNYGNARTGNGASGPNIWSTDTHQYAVVVQDNWNLFVFQRALSDPDWLTITPRNLGTVGGGSGVPPFSPPGALNMPVDKFDTHNCMAIAVDGMGYIHIVGNMHNDPRFYIKSVNPNSIASWGVATADIDDSASGLNLHSYNHFRSLSDGTLIWFFDQTDLNSVPPDPVRWDARDWLFFKRGPTDTIWTKWNTVPGSTGEWGITSGTPPEPQRVYVGGLFVDPTDAIHVFGHFRDDAAQGGSDPYYLKGTENAGVYTWKSVTGTTITMPFTRQRLYDAGAIIPVTPPSVATGAGTPFTYLALPNPPGTPTNTIATVKSDLGAVNLPRDGVDERDASNVLVPHAAGAIRVDTIAGFPTAGYLQLDTGQDWLTMVQYTAIETDALNGGPRFTGCKYGTGNAAGKQVVPADTTLGSGGICLDSAGLVHITNGHKDGAYHHWWDGTAWQDEKLTSIPVFGNSPTSLVLLYGRVWALSENGHEIRVSSMTGSPQAIIHMGQNVPRNALGWPNALGQSAGPELYYAHTDQNLLRNQGIISTMVPFKDIGTSTVPNMDSIPAVYTFGHAKAKNKIAN